MEFVWRTLFMFYVPLLVAWKFDCRFAIVEPLRDVIILTDRAFK